MLSFIRNKSKYILSLVSLLGALGVSQTAHAAGDSASPMNNPLALIMIVLMVMLLIIIGVLANILLGTADIRVRKNKKAKTGVTAAIVTLLFLLPGVSAFAQDAGTTTAATTQSGTIAGMSSFSFYVMSAVIFLELFIILALLINIRFLLKNEKEKLSVLEADAPKKASFTWWDRLNSFKPAEQEADLDLGHDYDGIRELNNRLPPWWLYGFYVTIIFAAIYLYRFHISHTGPSSIQEYENAVAQADVEVQEYLKKKGDAVDENTAKVLTDAADIEAGKKIYNTSCVSCHMPGGAGNVGPNLTDDYWLHGGDIKSIFKTIRYGFNAMPQWQTAYSNKQIEQVASYVKSLHGTNPPNPKEKQGELYKEDAGTATDSTGTKPVVDSTATKENKVAKQ